MNPYIGCVLTETKKRNASRPLFLWAITDLMDCLGSIIVEAPEIEVPSILEHLVEPERQVIFRICWTDDHGKVRVNLSYRIGFNSALGSYKGGLRFLPSVNLDIVKFLAFEQIFKNSLTGISIGGGKSGSNFDPKGKSDGEIMRFCQTFMSEFYHFINENRDVPVGDIGVEAREIGHLFGQYKRLTHRFESGALTGKKTKLGGSLARKEATGFGAVYFAKAMLGTVSESLQGKTSVVSGSGNVAIY